MRRIRRLSLLALACLLAGGCANSAASVDLAQAGLYDHLPAAPDAIVVSPSYEMTLGGSFRLLAALFGPEGVQEVRNKFFHNLRLALEVDLLNRDALLAAGFALNKPIAIALLPGNGFWVSLPLTDAGKASRLLGKFVPGFERQASGTNALPFLVAERDGVHCIVAAGRAFLFRGKPAEKAHVPAHADYLGAGTAALFRAVVSARAAAALDLPRRLFPYPAFRCSLDLAQDTLALSVQGEGGGNDPFITHFQELGTLVGIAPATLLGWGNAGDAFLNAIAPGDVAALSVQFSLQALWRQTIRPRIIAEAEKQVGKQLGNTGGMLANLLGGGTSLAERVVDSVDVEGQVLAKLTGRIGVIVEKLDGLPIRMSPAAALDAVRGVLAIEAVSAQAAGQVLEFLESQLAQLRLVPAETVVQGQKLRLLAFPGRFPSQVFYVAKGNFIFVAAKAEPLLRAAVRSGVAALGGSLLAGSQAGTRVRYQASLSGPALYRNLVSALDDRTRANLLPFEKQVASMRRVTLRHGLRGNRAETTLAVLFTKALPEIDYETSDSGETDWVLLLLGFFLASLFLVPLGSMLYRRIRYRG